MSGRQCAFGALGASVLTPEPNLFLSLKTKTKKPVPSKGKSCFTRITQYNASGVIKNLIILLGTIIMLLHASVGHVVYFRKSSSVADGT